MLNPNLEVQLTYYFQKRDMPIPNLALQIETNCIPSDEELDHIKNSIFLVPTVQLANFDLVINRMRDIYSSSYNGTALGSIGRNRGISQFDITSASNFN